MTTSLDKQALTGLLDRLSGTDDEVPEALSALGLPKGMFCDEDIASAGVFRCPCCDHWVYDEDFESGSCPNCDD